MPDQTSHHTGSDQTDKTGSDQRNFGSLTQPGPACHQRQRRKSKFQKAKTRFQAFKTWFWMVRCHRHPSSERFPKETTPVPCQSASNHTISDPPEIAIDTPKHDKRQFWMVFCHLDLSLKGFADQQRPLLFLETAAAKFQAPKTFFGWSIAIQTCILKVVAVEISKHNFGLPKLGFGWPAAIQT